MTPAACCEIGSEYAETGTRRIDILEEAARAHAEKPFNHSELANALRETPEIVDGWLLWSEDKRWSPAWYFSAEKQNSFHVGYYTSNSGQQLETRYEDRYNACAAFIVHELEDYKRLLAEKGKW